MSTALATIDPKEIACLDPNNEAMEAYKENCGDEGITEADLVRVKLPSGGGSKWIVPLVTGEDYRDTIDGILVQKARRGVLWAGFDPVKGDPPVLVSRDLMTCRNEFNVEIPADLADGIASARVGEDELGLIYGWHKLPYTKFGTGKDGIGCRAKEQRILFILPIDQIFPLMVTVGPGSIKEVNKSVKQLSVPYYRAIVSLNLEPATSKGGTEYSRIRFRHVDSLDKEAGKKIYDEYSEVLKETAETMAPEREET